MKSAPTKLLTVILVVLLLAETQAEENRRVRPRLRLKKRIQSSEESRLIKDLEKIESASAAASTARHLRTRNRVRARIPPTIVTPQPASSLNFGDATSEFASGRVPFSPSRTGLAESGAEDGRARTRFIPSRSRAESPSRGSLTPKLKAPNPDGYKFVCYYTNWSQYRPKTGKFVPEDIDPFLCTHIIFAFGWISNGKLSSLESNDVSQDGKAGLYQRVVGLKAKNPKLSVLLAVGGWSFGTTKFKQVAENRFTRQKFIQSALRYLREYQFDGLDLDWEYPKAADKETFVALVKELSEAFEGESQETNLPKLQLSAAVPVGPDNIRGGYDVPNIAKYLDFINLMAYDFHGKWESQSGHNAPLYAPSSDSQWRKQLSVSFAAQMWVRLGTPKEKLVIGMPTYGRSFTLANPNDFIVNSPTTGGGESGTYTREAGVLAYYEICDMLLNGASYIWDDEMQVPYLVKGDQWVGFDDEKSIRIKMKWLMSQGYGGAMVWSIDMDDFRGDVCGSGVKYPLMGAIREELHGTARETIAPGIEPADIDWSSVASVLSPAAATTIPPPTNIVDIAQLLKEATGPKLPALLAPKLPSNMREPKVFCYYTNWSYKRPGMGKFTPEDIDPTLCTHIVFAFATIKDNKLTASEENDVGDAFTEGTYDRIMKFRELNPKLKILLAVGGWAFGSEPFREVTMTAFRTSGFVYDAIEFLRKYNFDGLDIDWEYPRGPDDKASFVSLIKELRLAIEGEAKISDDNDKLILTAAVPATFEAIELGYDVPELAKYLDFINVMTYDFHGQWEKKVGHNSPLFPLNTASSLQRKLTVDYAAKEWARKGAPLEKLIIGMPVYGRTFTLADTVKFDIGAETKGGGDPGKYTGEAGFMSYYEICDFLHQPNTTLVWDNEQQVPFAYRGDQWVGFDDERSLRTKMQWLKTEGFGGIMVWSIDLDDFRGYCGTGKYPLLRAMRQELEGYLVQWNYKGLYETLEPGAKVVKKEKKLCQNEIGVVSFHRDKAACQKYFVCQGEVEHHKSCPDGLVFNEDEGVCDWPANVEQCANLVTAK